MTREELRKEYDDLRTRLQSQKMYDGRGKGVDVYVCKKCGRQFYTRYIDLGVTPFTIKCRNKECKGLMMHENTIDEVTGFLNKLTVHNWVRPPFEWLDKQRENNKIGVIDHVLNGGLILEEEL